MLQRLQRGLHRRDHAGNPVAAAYRPGLYQLRFGPRPAPEGRPFQARSKPEGVDYVTNRE